MAGNFLPPVKELTQEEEEQLKTVSVEKYATDDRFDYFGLVLIFQKMNWLQ